MNNLKWSIPATGENKHAQTVIDVRGTNETFREYFSIKI